MRKGPGICPACGADILWIKASTLRRALPVEPEPVRVEPSPQGYTYLLSNGCFVIGFPAEENAPDRFAEEAEEAYNAEDRPKMVEAYVSHYYISPDCGHFRRPRDRSKRMRKD